MLIISAGRKTWRRRYPSQGFPGHALDDYSQESVSRVRIRFGCTRRRAEGASQGDLNHRVTGIRCVVFRLVREGWMEAGGKISAVAVALRERIAATSETPI